MQSAGFFVVACETVGWGKTFLDYYQQSFALGDYYIQGLDVLCRDPTLSLI